jgi:hypothetical protein
MIETTEPLLNKEQTASRIKELVKKYASDLKIITIREYDTTLDQLTLEDYFDFVKNIPYRKDTAPIEVISRPYYICQYKYLGMDCKKKAVLMAAWCACNHIKYRFIGSSKRPDKKVHHIYVQALLDGQWENIDATYDYYSLYDPKTETYSEVF